jgi:hypothetical protein
LGSRNFLPGCGTDAPSGPLPRGIGNRCGSAMIAATKLALYFCDLRLDLLALGFVAKEQRGIGMYG